MEHKEYKLQKDRERFFWWDVGRRSILHDALRRHTSSHALEILDVGCGPGGNILFLKKFGKVTGLDTSKEALSFASTQGFFNIVQGDGDKLPFGNESFDLVSALDVIEHMENDTEALREIFRVLKKDGIFLLTVPAYPWMWSEHDEAVHHKRRYRREELFGKINAVGFQIKTWSHFVIPSIPFRALKISIRKIKYTLRFSYDKMLKTDVMILPPFLNALLIGWLALERYCMRIVPLPFGSSILVVAKKKNLD